MGAGPFKVTVPVELPPPTTVIGLSANVFGAGGLIVSEVEVVGVAPRVADKVA